MFNLQWRKRDILQIELQNIHPNMTISEIIIIGGDLTSIKDKNHQKTVLQSTTRFIKKSYAKRKQLYYEQKQHEVEYYSTHTHTHIHTIMSDMRNIFNNLVQGNSI